MFRNLLNPENALMTTMTHITDCIFLSLFWIAGCFPLVTVGASSAALYDASFRLWRKREEHPWQRFFRVFRNNWRAGILPSAVYLAAVYALARGMINLWNSAVYGQISWALFSGGAFAGILALGVLSVMFPMLSRFDNSFGALMKNTVLLAMANLPRTIALGMVNAAAALICVRFVIPLLFLPALSALVSSFFLEPMFKPYMEN